MDGASLNATDENGNTALLVAAEKGDEFWKIGVQKFDFVQHWTKNQKPEWRSSRTVMKFRILFKTSNNIAQPNDCPKTVNFDRYFFEVESFKKADLVNTKYYVHLYL